MPVDGAARPIVPAVVMVPPVSSPAATMVVTVPVPDGAAQVPSPRQNVELDAPVPPPRLDVDKLPVTSAARFTAPKVGAPAALPCRTVVVVPSEPSVEGVDPTPPPSMRAFRVRTPEEVTTPDPVNPRMPPLVPPVRPVPPRLTASGEFTEIVPLLSTFSPEPGLTPPREKVVAGAIEIALDAKVRP